VRTAVVLFNLGGPDAPEAVRPFLFNLFSDKAIIPLPGPLRWLVATMISRRRAPLAVEIYKKIGGGSPLLANTEAQARALEAVLGEGYRCFIAMRYWHPRARAAVREVEAWRPDRIVLLPLYPQYSTTTTASSLREWPDLAIPTGTICCWPSEPGFIGAIAARVAAALAEQPQARVLFSAHGLPERTVRSGDPYQWQVERTVAAIVARIGRAFDHVVCYQSRVGPLRWIGPYTDAEIARAGAEKVPLVVVPVAFVSEHSETLVELDIEYRHLAERSGVPSYRRLPAVGTDPGFIAGLAALVRAAGATLQSGEGPRLCPASFGGCAFAR
jgi:ferrochelatase